MKTEPTKYPICSDDGRFWIYADGTTFPIVGGGSPEADPPFPAVPEDLSTLDDDALAALADELQATIDQVGADPQSYVSEALSSAELLEEMTGAVEDLEAIRVELAAREAASNGEPEPEDEPEDEPAPDPEPDPDLAARAAELADRARTEPEPEPVVEAEPEPTAVEPEPASVVASGPPAVRQPLPRPARSRRAAPASSPQQRVSLTAAAGQDVGAEIDPIEAAALMISRRDQFGIIPEGTSGEKVPIARARWGNLYPEERQLDGDVLRNQALIASVLDQGKIKEEFQRRREGSLVAAGGLCAPVTPYYGLAEISDASRPVRAALPSFSADRGGIRFARPASLSAITTGLGTRTAAQDFAGGTEGAKTCQRIACPPFSEVDVAIIFHCLTFGNLTSRTFPELLAQWNSLVLAAQARMAESALLTGIDTASTAVTADSNGLGIVGAVLGQILAAASGMRSRHRMAQDAVLRLLMPAWAVEEFASDWLRGQYERFDSVEARFTAWLRAHNIEPSYHLDGAAGAAQVFGTQSAGELLAFPPTVRWYLFPEGSFLFLDGGTLELGLVRDSVLNASNDFQIFGETFENVAFIGVESLAVTSTACDSGTVSAPAAIACPTDYGP